MRPRPTSGRPTFAVLENTRRWQASAISSPPPKAKPLTAAITGFPQPSIPSITHWPRAETSTAEVAVMRDSSAMSAPATNAFGPAPVTMAAPIAASSRTRRNAASSASSTPASSAFSFSGRLIVTRATRSATATSTVAIPLSPSLHVDELAAVLLRERRPALRIDRGSDADGVDHHPLAAVPAPDALQHALPLRFAPVPLRPPHRPRRGAVGEEEDRVGEEPVLLPHVVARVCDGDAERLLEGGVSVRPGRRVELLDPLEGPRLRLVGGLEEDRK